MGKKIKDRHLEERKKKRNRMWMQYEKRK